MVLYYTGKIPQPQGLEDGNAPGAELDYSESLDALPLDGLASET